MDMADTSIETLFQEKLTLYQKLVAVLKEEKKQINGADVAALWRMSGKKQTLADEIEQIRGRILDAAAAMAIDHGMTPKSFQPSRFLSLLPPELKRRLDDGVQFPLLVLKEEIKDICLDNKHYVEVKLGMINELMSIMTGQDSRRQGYGGYGAEPPGKMAGAPRLFRREV